MENIEQKLTQASDKINEKKPEKKPKVKEESIVGNFGKFCLAKNLVIGIGGKQYLKAEAWQYLANLVGVIPSCECITMLEHNDETGLNDFKGVKVICTLKRSSDFADVSSSTMVARCEEEWLKDKDEFAVYGMAQTRAIARAVRNIYGWVAVAAGYEATPYDEMPNIKNSNTLSKF